MKTSHINYINMATMFDEAMVWTKVSGIPRENIYKQICMKSYTCFDIKESIFRKIESYKF